MSDRTITFKGIDNKRFTYEIPYSFSHVMNLYPKIKLQFNLDASSTITLFVTLATGKQYIFKPEESIDTFIETSKGGIVTIYAKSPAPQRILLPEHYPQQQPELKPNEELHMVNRGHPEHTVIEGKKALITGGLTIDLGCGASVHIPEGHSLLKTGKKIGFQQIQTNSRTFGCSPVVNLELLDE